MVLPLVPIPSSVIEDTGVLALTTASRILADEETRATAVVLAEAVQERAGLRLDTASGEASAADIVLHATGDLGEGYRLVIGDRVEIAGGEAGLFYGIQTLRQLLSADGVLPRLTIEDAPRFAHRGVMLDVARTFFDLDTVKAFIDRASALKFNRLHLHLTDDQGWRIEVESRPLLAERASTTAALGRPGGFFTRDDYREIVSYAAAHHMIVIPEIDLPGHTHAIGVAHPDLVEEPVLGEALLAQSAQLGQPLPVRGEPYQGWGVGHSSVRIHHAPTWELLTDVLSEIAELTPGPYLHIGGDEALGTDPADFDAFIERVTALVTALGKTPMAWHEAGSADVATGTIGQFWGSAAPTAQQIAHARAFAERGGSVVLSPSNVAYLDQKYDEAFPLGLDWAALIDLETAYGWEPSGLVPGLSDDAILGIEGPLWAETLASLDDIDQLFFPRAAALAEIAWSPASAKGWEGFRARIGRLGTVWDAAGWGGHRPLEIDWSAR
ncbi:family 20 glycosylhydrolase [Microbacterium sp. NPDC055903]